MSEDMPIDLDLNEIILDSRLQMRAELDMNLIDEYAEHALELPPGKVVRIGEQNLLTDGWHTFHARRKAGLTTMRCVVRDGAWIDALAAAAGANHTHGKRRSNADKRRAVQAIMHEMPDKSDREIARLCHVGHPLVAEIRAQLLGSAANFETSGPPGERVASSGRSSSAEKPTSNSANVGASPGIDPRKCTACNRKLRVGQVPPKRCRDCDDAARQYDAAGPDGEIVEEGAVDDDTPTLDDCDHPPAPVAMGMVDDEGVLVPQRLLAVFALAPLFREVAAAYSKAAGLARQLESSEAWQQCKPGSEPYQKSSKALTTLARALRDNRPALVCRECNGDGGPCCEDRGFLIVGAKKGDAS